MGGLPRPERGWSLFIFPLGSCWLSVREGYGLADLIISCIVKKCNRAQSSESANQRISDWLVLLPRLHLDGGQGLTDDHIALRKRFHIQRGSLPRRGDQR